MPEPVLLKQEDRGVLTLLLNRPDKRNALNGSLVESLISAFEDARDEDHVRVILLRGAGPDFCAGADLAELGETLDASSEESLADARRLGSLLLAMRSHPKPIIAAVHGRALAGGCGLATACDLILAVEDAQLGYPEVHLGFVPAMVMAILRKKISESRAFHMVAMGHGVSAQEAHAMGLVNQVLPADAFQEKVVEFSRELARRPPSALALTKGLLYEQADLSVAQGVERGAQVNVEARQTEACRDGVRRFLARKRDPSS